MARDQESKRARIREAAAALLLEKGYAATSMLQVARRASASNETLYRWYGGKPGLFRDLVAENAAGVAAVLETALADGGSPLAALRRAAPVLLGMVTGPLAVALNRAAAADQAETATLGPALAAEGRERVLPLLERLIGAAMATGELGVADPADAAELYVSLLIGDLQIRLVTGAIGPLSGEEVASRAERAFARFTALCGAGA